MKQKIIQLIKIKQLNRILQLHFKLKLKQPASKNNSYFSQIAMEMQSYVRQAIAKLFKKH